MRLGAQRNTDAATNLALRKTREKASEEEISVNRRSKSAIIRGVEKDYGKNR